MSDAREELGRLQDDFQAAAGPFLEAAKRAGPVTMTDGTGAVAVTLDSKGRLTSVRLANDWERRISPESLGPVIVKTYIDAAVHRNGEYVAGVTNAPPGAGRLDVLAGADSSLHDAIQEAIEHRAPDLDDEAVIAGMLDYLEATDRAFDECLEQLDLMQDARIEGRSSSGHVTAVVNAAGQLLTLECDSDWLSRAHPFNISREAMEAFNAALGRAALADPAHLDGPIGALRSLTTDPQTVLGYLNLA